MFDNLDRFGFSYKDEQKLFKNMALFEFESICVPSEELKDTNTTTWSGKRELIYVSISYCLNFLKSNLAASTRNSN